MRLRIVVEVDVLPETTVGDLGNLRGDLREFLLNSDASIIVKRVWKIQLEKAK
jgi:hypothetical protein